ncbi:MAG: hypothetical protein J6Q85_07530 [Clostridia bacterium]|nr:hypothetical protein [Clostridia bacterium]
MKFSAALAVSELHAHPYEKIRRPFGLSERKIRAIKPASIRAIQTFVSSARKI